MSGFSNTGNIGNVPTMVNIFNNPGIGQMGPIEVEGDMEVKGDLYVHGAVTLADSGGFIVPEHAEFESTATFNDVLTVNNLEVQGPTNFSNTVTFNDAITVTNGITGNITGDISGSCATVTNATQPAIKNLALDNLAVENEIDGTIAHSANAGTASRALTIHTQPAPTADDYFPLIGLGDVVPNASVYTDPDFTYNPHTHTLTVPNCVVTQKLLLPQLTSGIWTNSDFRNGINYGLSFTSSGAVIQAVLFDFSKMGGIISMGIPAVLFTATSTSPLIFDLGTGYGDAFLPLRNVNFITMLNDGTLTWGSLTTGGILTLNQSLLSADFISGTTYTINALPVTYLSKDSAV